MSVPALSRRDLLGAGLRRRAREVPPPPTAYWGPGPLPPAPGAVAAVAAAAGPGRVLVLDGPGPLAAALDRPLLPPCMAPRLPVADGEADAVASCFGAVRAGHLRDVGLELRRVLRPGGRLAMAVWDAGGPHRAALGDAKRWGTYDGLVLALDRFAAFDAVQRDGGWLLVTAAA